MTLKIMPKKICRNKGFQAYCYPFALYFVLLSLSPKLLANSGRVDLPLPSDLSTSIVPCNIVHTIDIKEDKLLKKRWKRRLSATYAGRCLDADLIQLILNKVSKQYMKQGYVTTRPYLKPQNIKEGLLVISVAKGIIESVVDAVSKMPNSRIHAAFSLQVGKVLNLRHLETSLELMNRVSEDEVTMEIRPGFVNNASIIEVNSYDGGFPYRLKIGMTDRKGSESAGQSLNADLSVINPFEINDIFQLSRNNSRAREAQQSNDSWMASYSFPIVGYGLDLSASKYDYKQGVAGIGDTFNATGETKVISAKVDKLMFRNQKRKLHIALSLHYKDSKNYFADQLLNVSSYNTTHAQVDLTHAFLRTWGEFKTVYSFHQGTDWFNARTDNFFVGGSEQATLQFSKHVLDTNVTYFTQSRRYHIASNFHLQYTKDLLFNNDKLTVGSDYTVRGYLDRNLFGNNAWYIKNDAVKTWTLSNAPLFMRSISVFLGLDAGHVRCEIDNTSSCGWIYGSALGLKSQGEQLAMNMVWGHPWKKLSNNFKHTEQFGIDVIWSF